MASIDPYHRIHIRVDRELKKRLDSIFKWGEFNSSFVEILEWLCTMHDKHGDTAFLIFRKGDLSKFLLMDGNSTLPEKSNGNNT